MTAPVRRLAEAWLGVKAPRVPRRRHDDLEPTWAGMLMIFVSLCGIAGGILWAVGLLGWSSGVLVAIWASLFTIIASCLVERRI